MRLTCGNIFRVLSEDVCVPQTGWGVSGGPESCNWLCLRASKTAADIRHCSFQRARQMQCLLQTETTSFHPHRLKTHHTRVSGVYGSRLKRFLTTELREQWQLRIINITGSHVINYSVNSVFFSLIHASKVTNTRTNMQVPYEAVLWQACVMLDMMSCYNDSAISQHNPTPIIHWQQCCKHCHMLLLYTVYYMMLNNTQVIMSCQLTITKQTSIGRPGPPIQSKSWAERDYRMIQDIWN